MENRGRNGLHYAVLASDLGQVRRTLGEGSDPNVLDASGGNALHSAARVYAAEIARELIAAGTAVDGRDNFGNTPLWTATFESRGRGDLIKILLAAGADPNSMNNAGRTLLQLAKSIQNYGVANFFSPLPPSNSTQRAVLHALASIDDVGAIRLELTAENDVNGLDDQGQTALHIAAANGSILSAGALLHAGAVVDPRDSNDRTPLYLATAANRNVDEMVMLLRGAGADPFARDRHGISPFGLATLHDNEVSKLFSDVRGEQEAGTHELVSNAACLASKSVAGGRASVGAMSRVQDGKWHFIAGTESQDFIDNPDNTVVTSLRGIVSANPAVFRYLGAPIGTYLVRAQDGQSFHPQ